MRIVVTLDAKGVEGASYRAIILRNLLERILRLATGNDYTFEVISVQRVDEEA